MKTKFRLLSVLLTACAFFIVLHYAYSGGTISEADAGKNQIFADDRITVRVWYDDESMTDYLGTVAAAFNDTNREVRMQPELVSGLEYIENINKSSVDQNEDYPDLYIATNDVLEKATLAGLAIPVEGADTVLTDTKYPQAALSAAKYKDTYVAYPYYFETSSLLYNRTYLEDNAVASIEAEQDAAEGEQAMADIESGNADTGSENMDVSADSGTDASAVISQDQIDSYVETEIPKTITDVIKFSENYNAPENVEALLKWDVSDIFYNFFFIGNYIDLGGTAGDSTDSIDLYNNNTISCLDIYQQLNQIFAVNAEDSSYDSIMQDFIDGKIVYTIATTDALSKIRQACKNDECEYEFGVAQIPDLNSDFKTRTMSVTNCICVNGYSQHIEEANKVAQYMCSTSGDDMYIMADKVPARYGVSFSEDNDNLQEFMSVYNESVPMPKMIETSNFWMQMEIAFTNIWNGADANDTLRALSEQIMTQINGSEYVEEKLPDPPEISLTQDSDYEDDGM